MHKLTDLFRSEEGTTAVEWSVAVALVSTFVIAICSAFTSSFQGFIGAAIQRATDAWPK